MEGGEIRYRDMDFFELAKILFTRIQKLEPENAVKIMGCIFLKEPGLDEMLRLALGSDSTLLSKIIDAKIMLSNLSSSRSCVSDNVQIGSEPQGTHTFSSPYWNPSQEEHSLHNQSEHYAQEVASFPGGGMGPRNSRRSQSLSDLRIKACHYFNKGYCKHGMNCRYSHVISSPDGYSNMFGSNITDHGNEDHTLTPKSIENLGMEIVELLRSKRGMPISIASLPLLYYEMYGKNLQADGYLTESQRHGKAALSLTKLLSHFRKSIRLIERPHGQHSVILAEDAPKYVEYRTDRSDLGSASAISSSHQIYLTFPAESTFTEDDVSKYFSQYGRVRDVRIPCQDKRMFGFVSFLHPETVSMILMKRNPHYICGARVLVKPYKEKSKLVDRTYPNKIKAISSYPSLHIEMDHDVHSVPRESDNPRLVSNHLLGDKELSMDFDRTLLSGLNLTSKTVAQQFYLPHGKDDLKTSEGPGDFFLGHFSHGFDSLNNNTTSDGKAWQTSNSFSGQESSQIELPESPFAYPSGEKSIFAVI